VVVLAWALIPVAACTGATAPATGDWTADAQAYVAAFDATWSEGATSAARFYAPDAHVDHQGLSGYEGTGSAELAQNVRDDPPAPFGAPDPTDARPVTPAEPVYLATSGMVQAVTLQADDRIPMAWAQRVGPSGITEELFARSPDGPDAITAARDLLGGYVTAWASGQPHAIGALYASDAIVVDSLAAVTASGRAAIAALAGRPAARGGLPAASLPDLPAGGDPAYYGAAPAAYSNGAFGEATTDAIVLFLDVAGDCPGRVAVQLRLDASRRIVREERFHRVDALRRCLPEDQRPHGWWEAIALPQVEPIQRTASIPVGVQKVTIWNGTGRHDGLLRWALQRFADAGLPPRLPRSVAFLPQVPDPWRAYGFLTGSNAPDIGVPVPDPRTCAEPACSWSPAAKHAMLHELAHLWLTPTPYLGLAQRVPAGRTGRDWAAAQGLVWDDPELAWEQRAGERAAEILAWGLMDQPDRVDTRLGDPSCAELAQDFRTLTHTTPDPRACPAANDTEQASADSSETTTTTG
jgi:hypothetical protein